MKKRLAVLLLAIGAVPLTSRGASFTCDALRSIDGDHRHGHRHRLPTRNPHMRIYFNVDNQGTTEKWLAEGGSRTQLMRVGWTGEEVKPGDKIIVRGHPPRDGVSKLVHMEYLTLPDGTERFTEDIRYSEFSSAAGAPNERRKRSCSQPRLRESSARPSGRCAHRRARRVAARNAGADGRSGRAVSRHLERGVHHAGKRVLDVGRHPVLRGLPAGFLRALSALLADPANDVLPAMQLAGQASTASDRGARRDVDAARAANP